MEELEVSGVKTEENFAKTLFTHITTALHGLLLGYVFFIIYLCLLKEFVFFTWHPLLFSIGWLLIMTNAILTISKDNILSRGLSHKSKIKIHWILQVISFGFCLIGFIVAVIVKFEKNKQHFHSWHAIFGLAALVSALLTYLGGVCALYSIKLHKYIKPKYSKLIHAAFGIITFTLGGITLILSVYTKWFTRQTAEFTQAMCLFIVGFMLVWTLFRPALNFIAKMQHVI